MSLSGSGGSQYGPQCSDLVPQLGNAAGVVQDQIGRDLAIFAAGLGGDSGLRLGATEAVTRHQPVDLSFLINIDSHDEIELLLLTGLDQQWDDMNHNGSRAGCPLQLGSLGAYGGVHDPLQILARKRISEHDLGKPHPIELPIEHYLWTEPLDNGGERSGARLDHLTCQHVGVDNDRTAGRKLIGDQALSRRDPSGKADP